MTIATTGNYFHRTDAVKAKPLTAAARCIAAHLVTKHALDDRDRAMLLEMLGLTEPTR